MEIAHFHPKAGPAPQPHQNLPFFALGLMARNRVICHTLGQAFLPF